MENPRLGYCCINLTLQESLKITINRGMVKRTFLEKGINYASDLSLLNVKDLEKIVTWNQENGIKMYRMSSDMFPWSSEYEFSDLPDYQEILTIMKRIGDFAKENGQRLTFHPSPYSVLASDKDHVVNNAIKEINQHAEIMDMMGLDRTPFYPINIHVNTTKPSKEESSSRFCKNFQRLSDSAKSRLVVENDDKPTQFTVKDLKEMIHDKIGIPVTFDFLHNKCNPYTESEEEALSLALSTWPSGITPITHYSDSRKIFEDDSSKLLAHTDWIWNNVETYGLKFDTEFEVKMKDKALLRFINEKCLV
jgi:UV DNA damage endonuclease